MGSIRLHDTVFDEAGKQCKVTFVSKVDYDDTYRLTFKNGQELVAGGEHEWWVEEHVTMRDGMVRKRSNVITTKEMVKRFTDGYVNDWFIPVAKPVELPIELGLPFAPHTAGTYLKERANLFDQPLHRVFLRGNAKQRAQLVEAWFSRDEDGRYETFEDNEQLAHQAAELLGSLGYLPHLEQDSGSFYIWADPSEESRHILVAAERIERVPMRCIQVDSKHHLYLVTESFIPTHNTRTGAEFIRANVEASKMARVAFVASTAADARDVMVEGEALALDTPIPSPRGWTTMGDVAVGDKVFDEHGAPCTVTWTSPVAQNRPCYEVEFSDGDVLVADAEHKWLTHSMAARLAAQRSQQPEDLPTVVTTAHIADTLIARGQCNHALPLPGPLQYEPRDLPLHPYVLGCWLGDGRVRSGDYTSADKGIIQRIRGCGYLVTKHASTYAWRICGIDPLLKNLRLQCNKHIPELYLHASIDQRLELLRGLMDTDGCISERGQCAFDNTNHTLISQVAELVRGLGMTCTDPIKKRFKAQESYQDAYRITFTPTLQVFGLCRKMERVKPISKKSSWRMIRRVTLVDSVPVRCIAVDSPSHLFLAGKGCQPTHNSGILAVSRPDFMPVYEPSKRRLTWPNGAIATTYSADEPKRLRGPQHDGAWCIAKDTLIATDRGDVPIQDVLVGDRVWTRTGFHRVVRSGLTRKRALVLTVHTEDGRRLTLTPNHRVFVAGYGWIFAGELQKGDLLCSLSTARQPGLVGQGTAVARVEASNPVDVYDLSIDCQPEFFAAGLLVHNCDEFAAWRSPETMDMLLLGLRLGSDPRMVVTTTPTRAKHIKALATSPTTFVTYGSTYENLDNLAPTFKEQVIAKYANTRLGRQELDGRILDDVEGALWHQDWLDEPHRRNTGDHPRLSRLCIAVDPSTKNDETANVGGADDGTKRKRSDACGIVVVAKGVDGEGYLLADYTIHGSPQVWADEVARAVGEWEDLAPQIDVVAEANQGGDMISVLLKQAGIPYKPKLVYATKGKYIRAEPAAQMYERGLVHHVGVFRDLEEELTNWVPGMASPNRLDALVWGLTHLFKLEPSKTGSGGFFFKKKPEDSLKLDELGLDEAEMEDAPAIFRWMQGIKRSKFEVKTPVQEALSRHDVVYDSERRRTPGLEELDSSFVDWLAASEE